MPRNKDAISELIGFARASESKTLSNEQTELLFKALSGDESISAKDIEDEKYSLVPGCKSCLSPCGHNFPYPYEDLSERKLELLSILEEIAKKGKEDEGNVYFLLKSLFFLAEDDGEKVEELIREGKRMQTEESSSSPVPTKG